MSDTEMTEFNYHQDEHIMETFGEVPTPVNITETLNERGKRYGEFDRHAVITQDLKRVMNHLSSWDRLTDNKKEALEMIAHKIGRILNGDPEYKDSWVDIAGYAQLVADTLSDD